MCAKVQDETQQQQQQTVDGNTKSDVDTNDIEESFRNDDPDEIANQIFDDNSHTQKQTSSSPNQPQQNDEANNNSSTSNPKQSSQQNDAIMTDAPSASEINPSSPQKENQHKNQSENQIDSPQNENPKENEQQHTPGNSDVTPAQPNQQRQSARLRTRTRQQSQPQIQSPSQQQDQQRRPQKRKRQHAQSKQIESSEPPPKEYLFQKVIDDPTRGSALMASCLQNVVLNGPGILAVTLSLVISAGRPMAYAKAKDLITAEKILANDPQTTVESIDETVRNDEGGRVALIARDTIAKRIRRSYEDMWKRAVTDANAEILRTTDFFETVTTWLEKMVLSRSRGIRIAACLAAFRLTDGMLENRMKVRKELNSLERLLQTERKKCSKGAGRKRRRGRIEPSQLSAKGQELAKKAEELTKESKTLNELAEELFSTIFVKKYRDVSSEIRAMAIGALGGWIILNPDHFLDEIHSKYIGWLLSDPEAIVRKAAINAINRTLRAEGLRGHLGAFLGRFCDRIVEMSRDKDDHVAVDAIDVLTNIISYEIMSPESVETVCEIAANEKHPEIRKAAGRFLAELSKKSGSDYLSNDFTVTKAPSKRGRGKSVNISDEEDVNGGLSAQEAHIYIRVFISAILGKTEGIQGCRRVVDAVWDSFPAMRCWVAMTNLLLDKDSPLQQTHSRSGRRYNSRRDQASDETPDDHRPLNEEEKTLLCGLLLSSVQELTTNDSMNTGKSSKKKDAKVLADMRSAMTKKLLPRLPEVLRRFQSDSLSLEALLQIPAYFDLEVLDGEAAESQFSLLLNRLLDVMNRNTASANISEQCARTLKVLLSERNPLRQQATSSLQTAFGTISKELSLHVSSDLSKSQPHSLASSVFRARLLTEMIEPNSSVQSCIKSILEYQLDTGSSELGVDIMDNALRTACAILVWSLSKIRASLKDMEENNSVEEILNGDDTKEKLAFMIEMQIMLRRICEKKSSPLSTRVTSMQMLLTNLTLSRGIEKYAIAQAMKTAEKNDNSDKSIPTFTLLLQDTERIPTTKAVLSCVRAILRKDICSQQKERLTSDSDTCELSNETLTACFASLIQASFQSSISTEIAHLPLLGLLMSSNQQTDSEEALEFSVTALCKEYAAKRRLGPSVTKTEISALYEAVRTSDSAKEQRTLVRKLAETMFSSGGKTEIAKRARSSIKKLFEHALGTRSDKDSLLESLQVLSSSSFVYLPHITHEDFKTVSNQLNSLWNAGRDHSIVDDDSLESSFFENLRDCVAELLKHEGEDISKILKMYDNSKTKKTARRRKRHQEDPEYHLSSPSTKSTQVRRSKRARTQIDYAMLEQSDSNEDENDASDGTENDSEMMPADQAPENEEEHQSPEEMARAMIQFRNSPRPIRSRRKSRSNERESDEVRVTRSPRKTRPVSSGSTSKGISARKPPKIPTPKSPRKSRSTPRKGTVDKQTEPNGSQEKLSSAQNDANINESDDDEQSQPHSNENLEENTENNTPTNTLSTLSRPRTRLSASTRSMESDSPQASNEGRVSAKVAANKENIGSRHIGKSANSGPVRPVIRRKRRRW